MLDIQEVKQEAAVQLLAWQRWAESSDHICPGAWPTTGDAVALERSVRRELRRPPLVHKPHRGPRVWARYTSLTGDGGGSRDLWGGVRSEQEASLADAERAAFLAGLTATERIAAELLGSASAAERSVRSVRAATGWTRHQVEAFRHRLDKVAETLTPPETAPKPTLPSKFDEFAAQRLEGDDAEAYSPATIWRTALPTPKPQPVPFLGRLRFGARDGRLLFPRGGVSPEFSWDRPPTTTIQWARRAPPRIAAGSHGGPARAAGTDSSPAPGQCPPGIATDTSPLRCPAPVSIPRSATTAGSARFSLE